MTVLNVGQQQFADSVFGIRNVSDFTKLGQFDASTIATGTTRLYSMPDASGVLALTSQNDGSIDHGADLTGLVSPNDDHTQYFGDTTLGTRTANYTTTGTVTAGGVAVDSIILNGSKIQFVTGGTVENIAGGNLTLSNVTPDGDIVLSYNDGGVTQTITIDASNAGTLISSAGFFRFANLLLPSGTVSIGSESVGNFFDDIVGDHIVGVTDVTTDVLQVVSTATVLGLSTLNTTIIDVTNTEALLVRKSGDTGDVFIVDTTNTRVGINVTPTTDFDLLGNSLITLTGTTPDRFIVDGSTNKIAVDGGLQVGGTFSNTYDGTLTGSLGIPIGYSFANTMEASFSGGRITVNSRCVNLANLWSGNITKNSGAGITRLFNLGIELDSSMNGTITVTDSKNITIESMGGRFTADFQGTLDETSGNLILNNIGGVSRARSSGVPSFTGDPEINYIGHDSIAEMPPAFSSVGTSIGHRFTASGGNDNIGARIIAISTANNENIGIDIEDISGATTNFAIRTGAGDVLFGDDVLLTDTKFLIFDKTSGNGIKVDTTTPTFGFADIIGDQFSKNVGATKPTLTAYNGAVDVWQFGDGDEAFFSYHIPHDYVAGTDIHLHIHWSQNAAGATGGTVDFKYTAIYAKGHNQDEAPGSFTSTPITGTFSSIDINDGGSGLNQYQQFLTEVTISAATATAALFDRDDLEPDGVIELTFELTTSNLTGTPSTPFVHFVDLHYQTTGLVGTKSRTPDFYV